MTARGSACAPPGAAPAFAYTLTFFAFFTHTLSELIAGLPGWAAAHGGPVDTAQYANATALLTLAAAALLLLGRTRQFNRPVQIAVAGLCGALLANVGFHLAASLLTWSPMPGLLTAFVLVGPSATWLLARLPLDRRTKTIAGLSGAGAMPLLAGFALLIAG